MSDEDECDECNAGCVDGVKLSKFHGYYEQIYPCWRCKKTPLHVEIFCTIKDGVNDRTYVDGKRAEKDFKGNEDEWRYNSRGEGDEGVWRYKLVTITLTKRMLLDLLQKIETI